MLHFTLLLKQFQRKLEPISRLELRQNKEIEQFQQFNLRCNCSSGINRNPVIMPSLLSALSRLRLSISRLDYLVPFNIYRFAGMIALFFYFIKLSGLMIVAFNNHGLVEPGAPFGGDFLSFYAASKLTLIKTPALVYQMEAHWAVQKALFGDNIEYFAFFYPPIFLLYCLIFGLLPYLFAVTLWIMIGLIFFITIMKRLGGGLISIPTILAFGGTYVTILVGQNSFLSAALIGAFALFLQKRPVLAGVMLGLLAFKPHLGLLIPFVLIAAGLWRSFFAASLTLVTLVLVSIAVFGIETWLAFFANAHMAVFALEENHIGNEKMHSLFGAARMYGAPLWLAYGLQATSAAIVVIINIYLARKLKDPRDMVAVMACGTLMMTPFILMYDLTILAIPLIWLYQKGKGDKLTLPERLIMTVAFILPMIANVFSRDLHVPLAPIVVIVLFCLTALRAYRAA